MSTIDIHKDIEATLGPDARATQWSGNIVEALRSVTTPNRPRFQVNNGETQFGLLE
jgi:hypothetical protein